MNNISVFVYTNHKGVTSTRKVAVDSVEFITAPGFNYQPGWFISGICQDKQERRSFALSHIKMPSELPIFKILDLNS